MSLAKMLAALLRGPCSIDELVDATGLHRETILRFTRALRTERAMHICAWRKDRMGRDSSPIVRLGSGLDVPKGQR